MTPNTIPRLSPATAMMLLPFLTSVAGEEEKSNPPVVIANTNNSTTTVLDPYLIPESTNELVKTQRAFKLIEEYNRLFRLVNNTSRLYKINFCKAETITKLLNQLISKSKNDKNKNPNLELFEKALKNGELDSFTFFVKDKDSPITNIYIAISEKVYKANSFARLLGEASLQAAQVARYFETQQNTTGQVEQNTAQLCVSTLENILENHKELDLDTINLLKFQTILEAKKRIHQFDSGTLMLVVKCAAGLITVFLVLSAIKLSRNLHRDRYSTEETKVVGRKNPKLVVHTIKNPGDTNTARHIRGTSRLLRSQQKKPTTRRKKI